jgi:hypothetical protein
VTDGSHTDSDDKAARYTGFEHLRLASGVSQDFARFNRDLQVPPITRVTIEQVVAGVEVTNLDVGEQVANIYIDGANLAGGNWRMTISDSGLADVVVNVRDEQDGLADLGHLTLAQGSGTLRFVLEDSVQIDSLLETSADLIVFAGTGDADVVTGEANYGVTRFEFTELNGAVNFDASLAELGDEGGLHFRGAATHRNEILDTTKYDTIIGGQESDRLVFQGGGGLVELAGAADTVELNGVIGQNRYTAGGLVFKINDGDSAMSSQVVAGDFNPQNAFDAARTDSINGLATTQTFASSAGSRILLDTFVNAPDGGVLVLDSAQIGATADSGTEVIAGGFVVVTGFSGAEGTHSYVLQDTNLSGHIDTGDLLMVRLVGDGEVAQTEFLVTGGSLRFTSEA